mmetsp:Transcript_90230/g.269206  ORF Transcript_90230/g.269206 Transcript_90230/m.269206 type:complete len:354 (-) Transcript_90230:19-1080(-)
MVCCAAVMPRSIERMTFPIFFLRCQSSDMLCKWPKVLSAISTYAACCTLMYTRDWSSFSPFDTKLRKAYMTRELPTSDDILVPAPSLRAAVTPSIARARQMGATRFAALEPATQTHVSTAQSRFSATSLSPPVDGQKYGFRTRSVCRKVSAEEYWACSASSALPASVLSAAERDFSISQAVRNRRCPSKDWRIAEIAAKTTVGRQAGAEGPRHSIITILPSPNRSAVAARRRARRAAASCCRQMSRAAESRSRTATTRIQSATEPSKDQLATWLLNHADVLKENGASNSSGAKTRSVMMAAHKASFNLEAFRTAALKSSAGCAKGTRPSSMDVPSCMVLAGWRAMTAWATRRL